MVNASNEYRSYLITRIIIIILEEAREIHFHRTIQLTCSPILWKLGEFYFAIEHHLQFLFIPELVDRISFLVVKLSCSYFAKTRGLMKLTFFGIVNCKTDLFSLLL